MVCRTTVFLALIFAACAGDPSDGDNGDNGDSNDGGAGVDAAPVATDPPPTFGVSTLTRDSVLSIAEASVGYTYWWGHGNLGGSKTGTCTGTCPNCTHSGPDGADCSGFVGKAWMLPEAMPIVGTDKHPFSTYSFRYSTTHWAPISRTDTLRADAMVYNTNGEGHIFLYQKDDPWGQMWTFEARGCSTGVVHNIRTAGTAYIAIRRTGL